MRKFVSALAALAVGCLGLLVVSPPAANAAVQPAGQLVSDNPADWTPHVLDGRVYQVAQVGNTVVLGGDFSSARNQDSSATVARSNLLAFNTSTGQISTSFVPNPNGVVRALIPAGDGESVYVGGSFSRISGQSVSNLARIRVSDGSLVSGFNPGTISGAVRDLRLSSGKLWVAGSFTHVAGNPQPALATVNPQTGAFDPYMSLQIAGVHNGGFTAVVKMDVNPQGTRLVAIGNFDTLDGVTNHQLFMLDTSGPSAQQADFQTNFYESRCSRSFDSYMRDLDFSPDGSFFVVSTTGAYGGSTGACDETARWDTDVTGTGVSPSWVDYTGGDTTYAVEITDSAVYVGGHQRWQNNPFAGDRPGPGAVSRPGIAALDPVNGLPFSWNPTRARGVGVFDFLNTQQGLWVASDTDRIGNWEYHGRIALMPANGKQLPRIASPKVPNDVYLAGSIGAASDPSVLYRVNAAGPSLLAATGMDWSGDTAAAPSTYHNQSSNRATYSTVPTVDDTVPAGTPHALFDSELWDPAGGQDQQWDFPVTAGTPLEVQLYFANRCTCTDDPGERVFDVAIDGTTVLDNFDISASVGHDVGTMRSFDITSDGNVDIDLSHVVENPLVNAIEIKRTDVSAPADTASLTKRHYADGNVGETNDAPTGDLDWNQIRGSFMVNGQLYTAWADGSFTRQSFDGTQFGDPDPVDTSDQLVVLSDWHNDISQATGMFYDNGRVYFTLSGSNQLYYRYLTTESGVVGAKRFVASDSVAGIDFGNVRGMFATGNRLYWATPNGVLHRIDWANGAQSGAPVAGTAQAVSGPGVDGNAWHARDLFLYQGADGAAAPQPPTASFTDDCTSLTCSFDASASTADGATITSYAWDFGDGSTGTGKTTTHTYDGNGTYTVKLTIGTDKGGADTVSKQVTVERVNQAPVASFTTVCDELACSFDASDSTDDGSVASYAWEFGDGSTGTGKTTTHTYSEAGDFTVKLTVTDDEGKTGSTTQVAHPSTAGLAYVAGDSTNGNRSRHTVQIPDQVRAGDTLLLFMTANTDSVTVTGPTGWTEEESRSSGNMSARLWTRTATAGDAGSTVTVDTSGWTKSDLSVVAYRGQGGTAEVTATASDIAGAATSQTTPSVNVTQGGSWLVSYWGGKSGSITDWTLPAGQVERTGSVGAGGGHVTAEAADSGGPVPTGATGGVTAVADANARTAMFSVVVGVEAAGPVQNQPPTAAFTVACDALACSFDASGSSDDGTIASYAWNFGDGSSGTGQTATHTYADAGDRTVRLTVTDDAGATGSTTRVAHPSTSGVAFVAADSTNGNRLRHTVQIPDDVRAGDTLVLFLGANAAVDFTAPAGWTEQQAQTGNSAAVRMWSKTAAAGDAGSNVVVTSTQRTKSDLTVAAYRGQGGATSIGPSASAIVRPSSADHVTPDVTVNQPGSWVLSYWAEQTSATPTWTLPTGAPLRASSSGSGGGSVSAVLSDSDGPVPTGTRGGVTATTSEDIGRVAMVSAVVQIG